jgi:hemerythrin
MEMDLQRRLGNSPSTIQLMTFLCEWLRDHVTTVDKELGSYLKKLR